MPVVSYPAHEDEALAAIMECAAALDCRLILGNLSAVRVAEMSLTGTDLCYRGLSLHLPLVGRYQIANCVTAIEALFALRDAGWAVSDAAIVRGIAAWFAQRGCKVTDLEMGPEYCADMGIPRKICVTESIHASGINPVTKVRVTAIEPGRVLGESEGKPVEFTFFKPQQYGGSYEIRQWPSFCEMLEGYYAEKDRAERLRTKSKELHKAVHNMYERAVRKQAARKEELAASEKSEQLRLYGELLSTNLYQAQKGMKSITVPNWYDEGREVTIPLDVRYTPSQNAQNYFKSYKKKQTAARMLVDLLAEGEKEIAYLETVLYEVESAPGEAALNEIRAELKSQGYLKYYKPRDRKQKPADFYRYVSSDGFEILVGRNNLQNERLTLHTARGKDLWFHTKNAPGSHTVVMSEGRDIPDRTREEAAQLAVLHSSQAKGVKVAVDYTEVKNIRKTAGLKPGMVLYDKYETAYITPDPALAEKLKKK